MTTMASTVPIASIVVLYLITSDKVRLVVIGLFTALFSFTLGLLTRARPIEIFSATAA